MNRSKSFHKIFCAAASFIATQSFNAHAADLTWDGFGSAYYGQALTKDLLPNSFSSTNPDFTDFSIIGLNLHGKLSDELTVFAQIIGSGRNDISASNKYSLFAQWAYVEYKPWEGASLRGGRQRFPVFSASEYINVGFYLPYRFIPSNVYGLAPFNSFDGVSVTQSVDTPVGKATGEVFGGTPILDSVLPSTTTVSLQRLLGARVALEGEGWRLRAQAARSAHGSVSTIGALTTQSSANVQTYTVGYRFDKYDVVSWAEFILRHSTDGTPVAGSTYLRLAKGGYALIGYRLGDFLPRYTFSEATSQLQVSSGNGTTTTHNIGVNYQPGKSYVVKAEYQIDIIPTGATTAYNVTHAAGSATTVGHSFYTGIDFIF